MAYLEEFTAILLLTVTHCLAQDDPCAFPTFMREAPGWDMGVKNEGRSSGSFIIFEESKMVTIDYENWNSPEKETICVRNMENDKVLVSNSVGDETEYKCIKFIPRSRHVIQLLESEPSTLLDVSLCNGNSLAINDWLLIWADTPSEYHNCGISGGYSIMDIHIPSRDQHFCEDLALPPRIEIECQHGEGILINFRYPQCVTDVNMPIYEMKFTCLGSWTSYGFTYTVITDGATFLPGLWLMRFPVNSNSDFYMDFIKDIVADRSETISQTQEYLRWKLVRNVFPSLCEDESSDCSDCTEDDGFFCQKTCQKCNPVTVQQRCQFGQSIRGEWLESSWTGSRTLRISSSLLYPAGLSPFECFVIGGEDSVDWLEITGRKTLVSVHKNGCRPRYSCVAINNINPSVIQYRLSQSIVWPGSENLQAEDICDYNKFQDDSPPLGNTFRSEYEKYLVKNPNGHNRQKSACNLGGNFVFSTTLQGPGSIACAGTLKQCSDETKMILHTPSCTPDKPSLTLNCLSSTVEVRVKFILVEDSANPRNIYCLVSSTDSNKDIMYMLHGADCHVNTLVTIQYRQFTKQIANLQSIEKYNSTTDCSVSDIKNQNLTQRTTAKSDLGETVTVTDATNIDDKVDQTTLASADNTTKRKLDQSTMPLFSKGFEVSSTEKQIESSTSLPSEFTTLSSVTGSSTVKIVNREQPPPNTGEVRSKASSIACNFPYYFVAIFIFIRN